ncbi:hypothetical protein ACVGVM_25050 [Pseudonocardia bannensis]|uniref:hypothetical protein n=1 Tax=Pseudonocardia bannensis TaxID=630973 RepID=UPI001B7CF547|nr:hypothetical protein [Pseudonocardia bannensis]
MQFLALAHVDLGSGLWPVVLSRLTSVLIIAMLIIRTGVQWSLPARPAAVAMASGTAGTAAIICYLFASRQQLLSTATVLAALYPAVPVVLVLMLLRERLSAAQTGGLLAAAAAASLVAI